MYRILIMQQLEQPIYHYYLEDGEIYETSVPEEIKAKYIQLLKTVPSSQLSIIKVVTSTIIVDIDEGGEE